MIFCFLNPSDVLSMNETKLDVIETARQQKTTFFFFFFSSRFILRALSCWLTFKFCVCIESYVHRATINKKFKHILEIEFSNLCLESSEVFLSSRKWPPFSLIQYFWATVYCNHPYFHTANSFYKNNIEKKEVKWG